MTTSSKKIVVKNAIAKNLVTRNAAKELFMSLKKLNKDKIILDFEGVVFMSRSFADEYLTQRNKFKAAELEEINMSEAIEKMLDVVSGVRTTSVETPRIKAHALSF